MKSSIFFVQAVIIALVATLAAATPASADVTLKGQECKKVGDVTVCWPTGTTQVNPAVVRGVVRSEAKKHLQKIEKQENERVGGFIDKVNKLESDVDDLKKNQSTLGSAAADAKYTGQQAGEAAKKAMLATEALAEQLKAEEANRKAADAALWTAIKLRENRLAIGFYGFAAPAVDLYGTGLALTLTFPIGSGLWGTDLTGGIGYAATLDYPAELPHTYRTIHGLGLFAKAVVNRQLGNGPFRLGLAGFFANNLGNLLEGQPSWVAGFGPDLKVSKLFGALDISLMPYLGFGPKRIWIDPLEGDDQLKKTECGWVVNGDYTAHAWQEEHIKLVVGATLTLSYALPL